MKNASWWSCDGAGHSSTTTPVPQVIPAVSRRAVLAGATLAMVSWLGTKAHAIGDLSIKPGRNEQDEIIVSVFLRGGADGLNMVVPFTESAYYDSRPSLGIPASKTIRINDQFGFNPALQPLQDFYGQADLAVLHAVGSQDQTRSHFEAMNTMERGLASVRGNIQSGWLARYLTATADEGDSPLRAIAFSSVMPDSLRGGTQAIAIESLTDFRLASPDDITSQRLRSELADLYRAGNNEIAAAGRETLKVLETLERLDPASYKPAPGAKYPDSDLGNGLRQVAFLIKNRIGLEVACLDKGGFDTHVAQGQTEGWFTILLTDLATSLAAFAHDLAPELKRVTIVVQTEFGRRLEENSGLGTDHGRGGVMMVLGGGVKGGNMYGDWPGLAKTQLDPVGDLRVTTDYRQVWSEILAKKLNTLNTGDIFPAFERNDLNLWR